MGYEGDGTLSIADGGLVEVSEDTYVAGYAGSGGAINFDNGTLTTAGFLGAVADLNGTGTINTHGLVSDVDLVFDATHGLTQTFTLNGPGRNITVNLDVDGSGSMGAGYGGNGSMHISDGVNVQSYFGYLGYKFGSTGAATVSGAGSTWTNSGHLHVGYAGDGTLDITDGGAVSSRRGYIGDYSGFTGAVTVSGDGSTWTNSSNLYVGGSGNGTLDITDGGAVSNTDGFIGHGPGSTGAVTLSGAGSTWTNSSSLHVGRIGDGTLNIADGGLVSVGHRLSLSSFGGDGLINIGTAGELRVTGEVDLGVWGIIDVNGGVLAADGINVAGGLLTNSDTGLVGATRLTISTGVVNATGPVTITDELAIGSEPVIAVTDGLFGVKGADLLNDPARELTLQGGQVAIAGGMAIDMPGTDLIVADHTILDLGAATSATFDELVFGAGSILTIDSDSPVSLFFDAIWGEGELAGSFSGVTITGPFSPGETGRVLTIEHNVSPDAVADYVAMLGVLGYAAEAENVAMAHLDGDSYPVISAVPEPATLSLLLIGGLLAVACRFQNKGEWFFDD